MAHFPKRLYMPGVEFAKVERTGPPNTHEWGAGPLPHYLKMELASRILIKENLVGCSIFTHKYTQ